MHDVIIVGSGAAGTFAALALRGTDTLVLDVGHAPAPGATLEGNLYELKRSRPLFDETIGRRFESLHNLENREISPKVRSPFMRFVIDAAAGTPAVRSDVFQATVSYAQGGLANAWGAQVYRFFQRDLNGFPLREDELAPHYDALTEHIGISGGDDDLTPFLGPAVGHLPPIELSGLGRDILGRYEAKREVFRRRHVHVGRPRLAVLSRDFAGRSGCAYDNLEFFKPWSSYVYTPAFTLRSLVEKREIAYAPGWLVESFRERDDGVEVSARELATGRSGSFECRRLVLCLGAIHTARLVLWSSRDFATRLPFVQNPCSFTPLLGLRRIGQPVETRSYSSQLAVIHDDPERGETAVAMIYAVDGLLRADLMLHFPLSMGACVAGAKYLLPSLALLQVFHPSGPRARNTLRVDAAGDARIDYEAERPEHVERELIAAFRRIGWRSHPRLIHHSEPGNSIHYAGSLPMRETPSRPYETDRDGLLFGTRRVHVGDAASFPRLPAKNLTFTIMANALRIGEAVRRRIGRSR